MTKTIIRAGTGGVGPLPVFTNPLNGPMPITNVIIDTKDLKDVSILLNFTCQINMTIGVNANLVFTVSKSIDGGAQIPVGGTYVYSATAEALEAETFGFQIYEGNVTDEVYTYSVQLAPGSWIGVAAGLTVTNATLSAIAVGEDNC